MIEESLEIENKDEKPTQIDRVEELEGATIQAEELEEERSDEIEVGSLSRDELISNFVELTKSDTTFRKDELVNEIAEALSFIFHDEEKVAFEKYINDGGEKDGFQYKDGDFEDFRKLKAAYNKSKKEYYNQQKELKNNNLERKQAILEELRAICDGDAPSGLSAVKKLQEDWTSSEPIPNSYGNELWANYKALLDRYFNNRHLNSQLRDLDKKKNAETKLKLCEKAEELLKEKSFNIALKKLNDLHQLYKEVGPAPEDEREVLWERFKTASDKIYEGRREYIEKQKELFKQNEIAKKEILERVIQKGLFSSDSIKAWKQATDEVNQLQDEWKKSGPVGRKNAKDLSKEFWSNCKLFFKNKSVFYQNQEGKFEENLKEKEVLCEEVEAILSSEEPEEEIKNKIIQAQKKWKEIGPVPRKDSDTVYKKFKSACDSFFDKQREQRKEAFKVYEDNLKVKQGLCNKFEPNKVKDVQSLNDFIEGFENGGEVPRKEASKIGKEFYKKALECMDNITSLKDQDKEALRIKIKVVSLADDPRGGQMIDGDRRKIKKEIGDLENDISTWQTNIQFFARSKNADGLRAEIDKKVEEATKKIEILKKNLKKINSLGK